MIPLTQCQGKGTKWLNTWRGASEVNCILWVWRKFQWSKRGQSINSRMSSPLWLWRQKDSNGSLLEAFYPEWDCTQVPLEAVLQRQPPKRLAFIIQEQNKRELEDECERNILHGWQMKRRRQAKSQTEARRRGCVCQSKRNGTSE